MSLYNDERPKVFSDVLGQEVIVRQMKKKIADHRFPHTALLTGPRGTGKTTCAKIIGKALNCDNLREDGEPCCQCESCRSIEMGMNPAVLDLDAATHNGVEDVRALIEQSQFVPAGRKKVFILDEVHMFSAAAWNALLKTLEEPPEDVVFILATTELQKVPLTVLSRALKFEFQKIGREVMQNYICDLCAKYQIGIEPGALSLVVTSAEGCMRDALSLLEQFIGCEELETETVREFLGLTSEEMIFDMLESMRDGDGTKALCIVEECEQRGKNMLLVVKAVLEALTYATAYRASGTLPAMSDLYRCRLKDFAESVPESRIEQFCGAFLQAYPLLARNVQLSFFLRASITNLVGSESLLSRLEKEVSCLKKGIPSRGCFKEIDTAMDFPQTSENLSMPEMNRGDDATEQTNKAYVESGEKAIRMEECNATDVKAFESVPDLGDYYEDIPVCEPSEEDDGETPGKADVPDVQKGQIIDVDELFRMVETCSTVSDDSSAKNIVQFKKTKGEEPAGQRYVAEDENDPFAAFDYYMAGGSARR